MWRCASNSLRKTFKGSFLQCKTVHFTNSLKNNELNSILKLSSVVLEHCHLPFNLLKGACENFADEDEREEWKKKKSEFIKNEQFNNNFIKYTGVFVAAGCFTVYYKYKRLLHISDVFEKQWHPALGTLDVGIKSYHCVLPEIQAPRTTHKRQTFTESVSRNPDEINFSGLEEAHQKVLGALNNFLGNQCMQSGQLQEAVEYFIQSAEEDHAPGIFNLGICHEKGYGTSQNYLKAAELYQRAADLGHATAMYNLGIFYAQGKGGIQLDLDHARELFQEAARLGQVDAANALNLEREATEKISENGFISEPQRTDGNTHDELNFETLEQSLSDSSNLNMLDDKVQFSCDSFDYYKEKETKSESGSDSGILDLSCNEPYVLLV